MPDLVEANARAYEAAPAAMAARAASYLPRDDSGLIGRNREWGRLYSPRFQLGVGAALGTALAAGRSAEAGAAFRGIEVASGAIDADGRVRSTLPPELGGSPSRADVASGAAFFLGDACLGMLALESSVDADRVVDAGRRATVLERLGRAVTWLVGERDVIARVDRLAPNRLLLDARAFEACAAFVAGDERRRGVRDEARAFVDAALALHDETGRFVEAGGHDTSYQGVALLAGEDVLLAGFVDTGGRLGHALASAARWLRERVDEAGRIDSSGNTRTCWSGETVFGERKRVSVPDVFAGLVRSGVRTGEEATLSAARRIAERSRRAPGAEPCHR